VVESAYLFVYGSLKRGYKHHRLLVKAAAEFLRKAKTKPDYLLYDCGPFACLTETPEGQGRCIEGEIFKVPITFIDEMDEAENNFERKVAQIRTETDKPVHVYVYKWSVSQYLDCGTSWPRE
jgi:gamma-glutamylcyclotransferase (GGCT)/AIG2-like uncharacterized protein YtfP